MPPGTEKIESASNEVPTILQCGRVTQRGCGMQR